MPPYMAVQDKQKEIHMNNNISLNQRTGFKKVKFELIGNKEIIVNESTLFSHRSVPISLSILEPRPFKYKNIAVSGYVIGGLLLALSILILVLAIFTKDSRNLELFIPYLLISLGLAVFFLRKAYKASRNLIIFTNINNGANVLLIDIKTNNESEINKFCEEITKRASSIRYPDGTPYDQKIEIYTKHLEYLTNEEVISEEECEQFIKRLNDKNTAKVVKIV